MLKSVKSNCGKCLFLPCIKFKMIIQIVIKASVGPLYVLVVQPLPH